MPRSRKSIYKFAYNTCDSKNENKWADIIFEQFQYTELNSRMRKLRIVNQLSDTFIATWSCIVMILSTSILTYYSICISIHVSILHKWRKICRGGCRMLARPCNECLFFRTSLQPWSSEICLNNFSNNYKNFDNHA